MTPTENKINPRLSREIIALFRSRGWTTARLARTLRLSRATVDRIADADATFTPAHVRALARSLRTSVDRMLFDAMEPAALKSKDRQMWVSTRRLLDAGDAFRASLRPKSTKKRRAVRAA